MKHKDDCDTCRAIFQNQTEKISEAVFRKVARENAARVLDLNQ